MADPTYVRLNEEIAPHGSIHDVESGWSIGGQDVQAFPKDEPTQRAFVNLKLRQGLLEPASKAEFTEVHGNDPKPVEIERKIVVEIPHQEQQQRDQIASKQRKLAGMRASKSDEDERDPLDAGDGQRLNPLQVDDPEASGDPDEADEYEEEEEE